jgi:hypothetical protein
VEVLLAVCLLVVVLVPILTSGSAIHRRSSHTEYRAIAAIRARTLLDLLAATDFELLRQLCGSAEAKDIDLDELFDLGTIPLLNTPSTLTPRVKNMLDRFKDQARYQGLGNTLARIDVWVRWEDPAARPGSPPLEFHLSRLIMRPESTLAVPYEK